MLFRSMAMKVNVIYSALIRREAILRAGNFDPKFRTSEDFDLWMRMLKTGARISYHREPLLHYRLRPESLTSGPIAVHEWLLQVLDKLETVLDLSAEERTVLISRRTNVQMELELARGKEAIQQGQWRDARWHLQLYRNFRPSKKLSAALALLRCCPWALGAGMAMQRRLLESGMLKSKPQRMP